MVSLFINPSHEPLGVVVVVSHVVVAADAAVDSGDDADESKKVTSFATHVLNPDGRTSRKFSLQILRLVA